MMITKHVEVKMENTYFTRKGLLNIEESMIHLINDAKLHQEISLLIQATGDKKNLNANSVKFAKTLLIGMEVLPNAPFVTVLTISTKHALVKLTMATLPIWRMKSYSVKTYIKILIVTKKLCGRNVELRSARL